MKTTAGGRNRTLATLVAGLAAALTLLATPARADAHAELLSSDPDAGQQLDAAPGEVVLHFSESVDITDDTLELLDESGARLEAGEPEHPGGDRTAVSATLPDVGDGAYVVAWRVVSSDRSHRRSRRCPAPSGWRSLHR